MVYGQIRYFWYSQPRMNTYPKNTSSMSPEEHVKRLLEWLASAHNRTRPETAESLYQQYLALREAPISTAQRIKFLDLFYRHTTHVVDVELGQLRIASLPASRKIRLRVKPVLDLLETVTQDYFNTLAELFDPQGNNTLGSPHTSLIRAIETIVWQIRINHLLASPPGVGLWQQLHAAFRTARQLGLAAQPGPNDSPTIERLYANILLAAIAQPASFSSVELEFISRYIEQSDNCLNLVSTPPVDSTSLFWIDLSKDFPAHAMVRRTPAADIDIIYFSCDAVAQATQQNYAELKNGSSAKALGLPAFAETHAGKNALQRLSSLWGQPGKRKFPRRKQSSRANLCAGLNVLWKLFKGPDGKRRPSEWMVTNESPDGYSLMHISGNTERLQVGDLIALQSLSENPDIPLTWQICLIRWAISENPEHIELGLELLAPHAISVEIAHSSALPGGPLAALILPKMPPLRPTESLVVPAGLIGEACNQIIVMISDTRLAIREVRTTVLTKQTSTIEIFEILPENST